MRSKPLILQAILLSVLAVPMSETAFASAGNVAVIEVPVTFNIENVNRSGVPCSTDGHSYHIQGHIIAPAASLANPETVTFYLHGGGGGEWVWHAPADTPFDHATELARSGHVSIVIDLLGYDRSGRPNGFDSCIGGHADIVHQVILQLRSGAYESTGPSPAFSRIVLAGHSLGGFAAAAEAYSFGDIDGLIVIEAGTLVPNDPRLALLAPHATPCAGEGEPADDDDPSSPRGYVDIFADRELTRELTLYDPAPEAAAMFDESLNKAACGEVSSLGTAAVVNGERVAEITVPVLLVFGRESSVFTWPAPELERARYSGSEVTLAVIDRAGHHIMAEKVAPVLQQTVSSWLNSRGF